MFFSPLAETSADCSADMDRILWCLAVEGSFQELIILRLARLPFSYCTAFMIIEVCQCVLISHGVSTDYSVPNCNCPDSLGDVVL